MTERMLGADALLWHMERPHAPIHTLKTAVLDPSRLGRPVTLDDLRAALRPRLGLLPRATQRVRAAPWFPGRPFWVDDPDFDLDRHLDEVQLPPPGDRRALDALHGRLAEANLDPDRPLWAATLVHGLEGGRQAIVVRVHHAVTDGLGALNSFLALTTDDPEHPVPTASPRPAEPVSDGELAARARRELPGLLAGIPSLVVEGTRSARRARAFRRDHPDLPPFLGSPRNFTNAHRRRTGARVCASIDLPFDSIRAVARTAGVTVNGVYHSLIAAALRDELLERGEDTSRPTVAAFGIADDTADRAPTHGNHVTPTNVNLFSDLDDPLDRLRETARSCREGVALRRATGVEMAGRWADITCRIAALLAHEGADRMPSIVNHVTTANVAGPTATRWAGPVEVVDWISFAIAVHPSNVNVTAYSYAGRMSVGLVTTPNVLPEPARFLRRMAAELEVLTAALAPSTPLDDGAMDGS